NNANVEKDLTVKGNSTVEGTTTTKDLNVTNNANVEKDLTVKGNSTVEGTTTTKDLNVTNNANVEKDLTVKGNSTVEGTTTTKDLNVTNNATINNLISENGTFNNRLTSTGETLLLGNTTVGGQGKTFVVNRGTRVDMGGNVLTNIAEGTNATDAATKGQLDKVVQNITNNLTALSNNPLTFAGNSGSTARKVGETLTISGDATIGGSYSSKNVNTVVTDGKVEIQIAENPEFETMSTTGNANIGGNLNVNGTTTTQDLNVTDTATLKDLNVTNNANVEKDLTVKGNSTVEGTTTTKDLNVTNNANVEKDLTVKG
ncbi:MULTISPECIES: hypothetical protein, partial [unclassified Pasteurella]|uniref:hypothetical protein n=2 Tax=unclassified Pasteurella TaxID=2621516 RepID=UPI0011051020